MSDLRDLYQEVILDHGRTPRNFGPLEGANRTSEGHNPLCGDHIEVHAVVDKDGRIQDVKFEGHGCAISTASASMMTDAVKGKTVEEARQLFEHFHDLVTKDDALPEDDMDKLVVLAGVREFPMRVKCATLAWHTLNAALENEPEAVTTE
ncbi:MAG TPA: SUF system NifU family Fe-S cluster assembly protein [Alphaproteobacteria bacterium]|nr:SUF system NifU family Fe-S cluster assembly protein [Alphaproteobacteria bacterium]